MTEQTETPLRDRIAAAIWERQSPGRRYADCEYRWKADAEADADAVLAVLPATGNRAAALLWAADRYEAILASQAAEHSSDPRYYTGVRDVILGLRRLAGEAQQDEAQAGPPCGDSAHRHSGPCSLYVSEAQQDPAPGLDRAAVSRALESLRAGNHITARLLLESAINPGEARQ